MLPPWDDLFCHGFLKIWLQRTSRVCDVNATTRCNSANIASDPARGDNDSSFNNAALYRLDHHCVCACLETALALGETPSVIHILWARYTISLHRLSKTAQKLRTAASVTQVPRWCSHGNSRQSDPSQIRDLK